VAGFKFQEELIMDMIVTGSEFAVGAVVGLALVALTVVILLRVIFG
jgi:hypothetical protein